VTAAPNPPAPVRVGLIALGCAKNLVDAEIMLGSLMQHGMEITNDPASADVVIVNTCSFIDAAQEESVDTILESAAVREARQRGQGLVVAGCLSQRFRDALPKLFPEVDAFMGIDQVARVPEIVREAIARREARLIEGSEAPRARSRKSGVMKTLDALERSRPEAGDASGPGLKGTPKHNRTRVTLAPKPPAPATPLFDVTARPQYIPDYATPRFRLTPRHFAYVKIAEGCNHPCSFCIIPQMRGSHRSRAMDDVVREAEQLLADGVKELNLISQDSTYYGLDLRPQRSGSIASPERFAAASRGLSADTPTLCTLIRRLNALPGDFWIRLLYTHPAHWTDELIETIAASPKVARYVDMPLQHIHELMLERMRRETSRAYIEDLIRRIRGGIPGIALRTTFIVGFPGETAACFDSLLEFIRAAEFERLGVFVYSREEGTRAGRMAGQIPAKEKQRRRDLAMAAQLDVSRRVSHRAVGRTLKVLIERTALSKDLQQADVSSWEHGLIRGSDTHADQLKGRYLVARGEADAPDIDGRVYVKGAAAIGEFATVRVVGHTDYDLIATTASRG
jgi:ribosomal protein S12 methylthiotransferase